MKCPECGMELPENAIKCLKDGCGWKKKKAKGDSVSRLDSIDPARWMTRPFTRTTDGFLVGRAIVTNVGVFDYRNADGSITRELRLPEEVFAWDSLETLKMKPVTMDHPTEMVTPENVREYQVGHLGNNPSSTTQERNWSDGFTPSEKLTDGFHVAVDMAVTETDAIAAVLNGKSELSMGYDCELEIAEPGAIWCGQAYDKIQRNIRYNHCAIVDRARAGDAAKIRLDSADAVLIPQSENRQQEEPMKTIKLDGVDYQAEAPVIAKLSTETARADKAETALADLQTKTKADASALEAERDALKQKLDVKEKELAQAKTDAMDPAKLNSAVEAKLVLLGAARTSGVEVKADMKEIDIKKAVISKIFPNTKLDGRDDAYIQASFNFAVDELASRNDANSITREVSSGGNLPGGDRDAKYDAAAARQRMIDRMVNKEDKEAGK